MSERPTFEWPSHNKRRKTSARSAAPSIRQAIPQLQLAPRQATATWPNNELPVEIYTLIIGYLPRSTVQNMRLVNKEFEAKVSEFLFRVVVVPFKSEIYGIAPEPSLGALAGSTEVPVLNTGQASIALQDKGMRVFQGFGRHIRRFAMSFEVTEGSLARPPIKNDQEAVRSYWGIYAWPYKTYNRYAQLEGLEQTADETRSMAQALRFIPDAKELGLSIDGGLGWLSGPDINQRAIDRGEKLSVFGQSRFPAEPRPNSRGGKAPSSAHLRLGSDIHSILDHRSNFRRMLGESGTSDGDMAGSVFLLEQASCSGLTSMDDVDSFSSAHSGESLRPTRDTNSDFVTSLGDDSPQDLSEDDDFQRLDLDRNPIIESPLLHADGKASRTKADSYFLKPNDLTCAQKEMLLEIEWAQCAFMQSWAIAVIDNPSTFQKVETLTIARLTARHLPIIRRADFWDSLPNLKTLNLSVIPDWREVVKEHTTWVHDNKLSPSLAISSVWVLLQVHIAHRKNIKNLRFEWLCGGEESPGIFSRNQHILAAPLVMKAMDMVNKVKHVQVLSLPYIENLTLKNCWASPHILTRFVSDMKKLNLETLILDSISLTAPLPFNANPAPLAANVAHMQHANPVVGNVQQPIVGPNAVNAGQAFAMPMQFGPMPMQLVAGANALGPQAFLAALGGGLVPPGPAAANDIDRDWLDPPRYESWAHVIEVLTPGQRLADLRYARDRGLEPVVRSPTRLKKLVFESCGYVRLPLDFDQAVIGHNDVDLARAGHVAKKASELESIMLKPFDNTLAYIINRMSSVEQDTLENAWNMSARGWASSRSEMLAEATLDGILHAGRGRFQGIIEVTHPEIPNS